MEAGETIEVTDDGNVVAILIPPVTDSYDRLVATGAVRKSRRVHLRDLVTPVFTDKTVEQILAEERCR